MTRVNLVPPAELHDKHLLAEYRELPRVFGLARPPRAGEVFPDSYVIGPGHVKFFYDKLKFLHRRFLSLVEELAQRGVRLSYPDIPFSGVRPDQVPLYNDYIPTPEALALNRARLAEHVATFKRKPAT